MEFADIDEGLAELPVDVLPVDVEDDEDHHVHDVPRPYEVFLEVHRCNVDRPDLQVYMSLHPQDFSPEAFKDLRVEEFRNKLRDDHGISQEMLFVLTDLNLWGAGMFKTQAVDLRVPLSGLSPGGTWREVPYNESPGIDDSFTFYFKVYILSYPHMLVCVDSRHDEFNRAQHLQNVRDHGAATTSAGSHSANEGAPPDHPVLVPSSSSSEAASPPASPPSAPSTSFYPDDVFG